VPQEGGADVLRLVLINFATECVKVEKHRTIISKRRTN
jgi:hypothetical protein